MAFVGYEVFKADKAAEAAGKKDYAAVWAAAEAAGMAAGNAAAPAPMVVFGGPPGAAPVRYFVPEGVCGFAWVVVKPGGCGFAKWAKANKGARAEYGGGMMVKWVGEFNQSMVRKEAYADAFARVVNAAGIDAFSRSRMD